MRVSFSLLFIWFITFTYCSQMDTPTGDLTWEEKQVLWMMYGKEMKNGLDLTQAAAQKWGMGIDMYPAKVRVDRMRNTIVFTESHKCNVEGIAPKSIAACEIFSSTPFYLAACSVSADIHIESSVIFIFSDRVEATAQTMMNDGDGTDPKDYIEATLAHEIGHCLGLRHSPDPQDLMFPVLTGKVFQPSESEMGAAHNLYDDKANDPGLAPKSNLYTKQSDYTYLRQYTVPSFAVFGNINFKS
ncbi:matrixin family metalloprotease [Leptospira semungkisensis]|nr:matrixin family metalloprotease [Leptospira semungkisensis]